MKFLLFLIHLYIFSIAYCALAQPEEDNESQPLCSRELSTLLTALLATPTKLFHHPDSSCLTFKLTTNNSYMIPVQCNKAQNSVLWSLKDDGILVNTDDRCINCLGGQQSPTNNCTLMATECTKTTVHHHKLTLQVFTTQWALVTRNIEEWLYFSFFSQVYPRRCLTRYTNNNDVDYPELFRLAYCKGDNRQTFYMKNTLPSSGKRYLKCR